MINKTAPPPSSHVIQLTRTIFELNSRIKETNALSKFHENWAKNVTSTPNRENCHYIHIEKNAPATGGHVFSPIWTIFELVREINKTNVLTNFHDDWATIGTSRVFTRKTDPPPLAAICELNRDFIGTKLLTKFHEDWTINVVSIVFTNKCGRTTDGQLTKTGHKSSPEQSGKLPHPPGSHVFLLIRTICKLICDIYKTNLFTKKLPPCSHVIQLTGTIFELNSCINETNVLTKFHENWAKNVTSRVFTCSHYIYREKNAPPTGGHVFSSIWTIFKLVRDINKTNVLTNLHDDWAKIGTSRVLTRKTAPPTGCHVFHRTETTFELNQHIIKANILTKFHENWAKNVTSIVKNDPLTRGHVFSTIWTIFELV
ncbi:hypothetical protein DPMN_088039 [Dreissena polymorpha]|uniref:Uncharacterized protein n=1 Tax=Dreissena polymorpha TaxID=45954 RepID=A0A9D4KTU0_DREPO|nr:hypothetical protein DPMN_088039 [Dreissena polymorpha]